MTIKQKIKKNLLLKYEPVEVMTSDYDVVNLGEKSCSKYIIKENENFQITLTI